MAKGAGAQKIVVVLNEPQEKKSVTRYDSDADDAAMRTAYVDKAALKKLGNPDSIRVTIEAA